MRWRVGVGSNGEPHVVGVVRKARPDLLTVDHVFIAIPNGARGKRREIGAGGGLGVPDREVTLAFQDLRRVLRLLLVGAELEQGRPHRVERQDGNRKARALHFVEKDELLDRTAALAPVFLRPADAEPPVGAQLLHRLVVERPTTLSFVELGEKLVCDEVVEIRAELVA